MYFRLIGINQENPARQHGRYILGKRFALKEEKTDQTLTTKRAKPRRVFIRQPFEMFSTTRSVPSR